MKFVLFILVTLLSVQTYALDCVPAMESFFKKAGKVVTVKSSSSAKVNYLPGVEKILNERVNMGEIMPTRSAKFITSLKKFKESVGVSLLGAGSKTCYDKFSKGAFLNLTSLLEAGAKAKTMKGAFENTVEQSKKLFGDTDTFARKRVCQLSSGSGVKCKMFSKGFRAYCK